MRKLPVLVGLMLAGLLVAWSAPAMAQNFHESGNLVCSECHTVHNSAEGVEIDPAGPHHYLLLGEITDVCLQCHSGAGVRRVAGFVNGFGNKPPAVMSIGAEAELPAGSFEPTVASPGNGHSLEGTGFPVPNILTAPGGTFATTAGMDCAECHAVHDMQSATSTRAWQYRGLRKNPASFLAVSFTDEILSTNADEAEISDAAGNVAAETDANHNVYKGTAGTSANTQKGFGAFCGACHSNPDDAGTGFHGNNDLDVWNTGNPTETAYWRHPTNTPIQGTRPSGSAYNRATNYVKWNFSVGATDVNYDPTIPMITTTAGALTTANWVVVGTENYVFCLSCHRAHASEFPNATRWDMTTGSGVYGAVPGYGKCGKCHGR